MEPNRTPARESGVPYDFAARLAELQEMLDILERTRANAGRDTRPRRYDGDPVALTQALHPNGLRPMRRPANAAPREGRSMPVRLVFFDGTDTN